MLARDARLCASLRLKRPRNDEDSRHAADAGPRLHYDDDVRKLSPMIFISPPHCSLLAASKDVRADATEVRRQRLYASARLPMILLSARMILASGASKPAVSMGKCISRATPDSLAPTPTAQRISRKTLARITAALLASVGFSP